MESKINSWRSHSGGVRITALRPGEAPRAAAAETKPAIQYLDKGKMLYCEGQAGHPWRVVSGALRLNGFNEEEPFCAGIAVAGDIIGSETLNGGVHGFEACALSFCLVEPWHPADESDLLALCAAAPRRMAEMLALRSGPSEVRVRRLVETLAKGQGPYADASTVPLPSLRNIGEITDLTLETVSRIFSRWRSQGYITGTRKHEGMRLTLPLERRADTAA